MKDKKKLSVEKKSSQRPIVGMLTSPEKVPCVSERMLKLDCPAQLLKTQIVFLVLGAPPPRWNLAKGG